MLMGWRPKERWVAPVVLAIAVIDLGAFVKDRGERPFQTLARANVRPVQFITRAQGYRSRYVSKSNLENYATLHGVDFAGVHEALVDARLLRAPRHEPFERERVSASKRQVHRSPWAHHELPLVRIALCFTTSAARYPSPDRASLHPAVTCGHGGLGRASPAG